MSSPSKNFTIQIEISPVDVREMFQEKAREIVGENFFDLADEPWRITSYLPHSISSQVHEVPWTDAMTSPFRHTFEFEANTGLREAPVGSCVFFAIHMQIPGDEISVPPCVLETLGHERNPFREMGRLQLTLTDALYQQKVERFNGRFMTSTFESPFTARIAITSVPPASHIALPSFNDTKRMFHLMEKEVSRQQKGMKKLQRSVAKTSTMGTSLIAFWNPQFAETDLASVIGNQKLDIDPRVYKEAFLRCRDENGFPGEWGTQEFHLAVERHKPSLSPSSSSPPPLLPDERDQAKETTRLLNVLGMTLDIACSLPSSYRYGFDLALCKDGPIELCEMENDIERDGMGDCETSATHLAVMLRDLQSERHRKSDDLVVRSLSHLSTCVTFFVSAGPALQPGVSTAGDAKDTHGLVASKLVCGDRFGTEIYRNGFTGHCLALFSLVDPSMDDTTPFATAASVAERKQKRGSDRLDFRWIDARSNSRTIEYHQSGIPTHSTDAMDKERMTEIVRISKLHGITGCVGEGTGCQSPVDQGPINRGASIFRTHATRAIERAPGEQNMHTLRWVYSQLHNTLPLHATKTPDLRVGTLKYQQMVEQGDFAVGVGMTFVPSCSSATTTPAYLCTSDPQTQSITAGTTIHNFLHGDWSVIRMLDDSTAQIARASQITNPILAKTPVFHTIRNVHESDLTIDESLMDPDVVQCMHKWRTSVRARRIPESSIDFKSIVIMHPSTRLWKALHCSVKIRNAFETMVGSKIGRIINCRLVPVAAHLGCATSYLTFHPRSPPPPKGKAKKTNQTHRPRPLSAAGIVLGSKKK